MSCDMWFGTKDYAQFIRTPQTGADVSPQAWGSSGTLLNGSGYAFNSFNSHKEYSFSWGASAAREAAQTMKSYFDGSFGRGKLHFVDPLTYSTNVLPARWADPSITADFEGPQLVPGVDPYTVPTSNFQWLRLPVRTAVFDLDSVQPIANTVFLPEAENLFTNPRLKGGGTWAEVRRNLVENPRLAVDLSGWSTVGFSNFLRQEVSNRGELPGHFEYQAHCWGQGTNSGSRVLMVITGLTAGETYPLSLWVRRTGVPADIRVTEDTNVGGSQAIQSHKVNGEWEKVEGSFTATQSSHYLQIRQVGNADSSQWVDLYATGVVVGSSEFFDGSTTPATSEGIIQPEDFRWRWLGEPNASGSVMEIERVAGVSTVGAIAGVSSWDGKVAARVIPLTNSNGSTMRLTIPESMRAGGTVLGTLSFRKPAESPYHPNYNSIRVQSPTFSQQSPNEVGTHPLRVTFGELSSSYDVDFFNGVNNQASRDVWWTDIGLFAGDYTGPWFSGDSEIPGKVTRWTGAPNNSTSQIGVLQPVSTPNVNEENSVFVPIPDGMQLSVGAFYSGSPEAGVYVVNATQGGSPGMNITRLQPLTPSDTSILPNVFTKAPGDIGVYIIFGKLDSVDAILNVTAIHARLSPIGVNPPGENYWLGGQGNEGVRFVQPPTYINHTGVNGGQVEFAATFKESIH